MKLYLNQFPQKLLIGFILIILWKAFVLFLKLPNYIVPAPEEVFFSLQNNFQLILKNFMPTLFETLVGMLSATLIGISFAILCTLSSSLKKVFWPALMVSQVFPTFAIAPLFVIWFGYGIFSKIALTNLVIFYPITANFLEGLKQAENQWRGILITMKPSKLRFLWNIQIPAALPHLATGLKIAAVIAPMGALIGEWVGATHGLGYLLLNANAHMQVDLMFGIIFIMTLFAFTLYHSIDYLSKCLIYWDQAKAYAL